MATKGYRTFIKLSGYELQLLRKLQKDLARQSRKSGKKAPTIGEVIQGCIRTAIHTVYGDDYLYEELLSGPAFERLMGRIDSSLLGEERAPTGQEEDQGE